MKKLLKYTLLAIMACGFVACGNNQYAIQYNTNPIGANIVCDGVGKGLSPLTLYYDRDGIDDKGFLYTTPCKAVFSSGYVDYFDNKWDTNKFPKGVQRTLTRPQGDGYQQDMAFGMEYQRTLIMQQQAEEAAWAAKMQQWNQINQGINQIGNQLNQHNQRTQQFLQQNKPTMCNTFGSITTCY